MTDQSYSENSEAQSLVIIDHGIVDAAAAFNTEMLLYESALDLMQAKLHVLSNEFRCSGDRSPIDNVQSRLKSPRSIAEKMQRKGIPMNVDAMEQNVFDIAGLRIVCPFLQDVYKVAQMLMHQEDIHVLQVKDYIKSPKESGYRSLHLIVTIDVHLSDRKKQVPVELQLRTIAMNCWASTEHQLRYKKEHALSPHVIAELKEISEIMYMIDRKAQRLADEVLEWPFSASANDEDDQNIQ